MKHDQLRWLLALCLFAAANAPATVRYVDLNSASPTPPYSSWATAAPTMQDAVDAATVPGATSTSSCSLVSFRRGVGMRTLTDISVSVGGVSEMDAARARREIFSLRRKRG